MAKKEKLLPCGKWNHHKFSPSRADIAAISLETGQDTFEQKCIFCDQVRSLVLTAKGLEDSSED